MKDSSETESMPPDSSSPRGTSLTSCSLTLLESRSLIPSSQKASGLPALSSGLSSQYFSVRRDPLRRKSAVAGSSFFTPG